MSSGEWIDFTILTTGTCVLQPSAISKSRKDKETGKRGGWISFVSVLSSSSKDQKRGRAAHIHAIVGVCVMRLESGFGVEIEGCECGSRSRCGSRYFAGRGPSIRFITRIFSFDV